MATNVHLTPELEAFVRACVENGKFDNVSEVVRAGLRLLQDHEEHRRSFNPMLDGVREETRREGAIALDTALTEMDAIIDQAERCDPPFLGAAPTAPDRLSSPAPSR